MTQVVVPGFILNDGSFVGTVDATFYVSDGAMISYTFGTLVNDFGTREVVITPTESISVDIPGEETYIMTLSLSTGATVPLLATYDDATEQDYIFFLDNSVATPTSAAQFNTLNGQIIGASEITTGPFAQGAAIDLTALVTATTSQVDNFEGGSEDDHFDGGAGDDVLRGGQGNDTLNGDAGNDTLRGEDDNDALNGGADDDDIDGGDGDDTLNGGTGDDFLQPGAGTDIIDGGSDASGTDFDELSYFFDEDAATGITVTYSGEGAGTVVDWNGDTDTFSNIERVRGTDFDDSFTGSSARDRFDGRGGDDYADGKGGTDQWRVRVDAADATLTRYGDVVIVATAQGTATTVNIEEFAFNDTTVDLADLTDLAVQTGTSGNDTLTGSAYDDTITGLAGEDTLIGNEGDDDLDGGDDTDAVDYSGDAAGVSVDLAAGSATDGAGDTDTLSNIENIIGSGFNDVLYGDDGANTIEDGDGDDDIRGRGGDDLFIGGLNGSDSFNGNAGFDTLYWDLTGFSAGAFVYLVDFVSGYSGGEGIANGADTVSNIEAVEVEGDIVMKAYGDNGDNTFIGGDADDLLRGRAGADTLIGNAGADLLNGQSGRDTADYSGSADGITINLRAGTGAGGDAEGDTLIKIENVIGTDSRDTITGFDANEWFWGGGNADTLKGNGGDDILYGGGGGDTLNGGNGEDQLFGEDGDDLLTGRGGDDTMDGGDGDDTLTGQAGNDILIGGAGADALNGQGNDDTLTGGTDADTFIFDRNRFGNDTVTDFEDDIDTLQFVESIWGGGLTAAQMLATYATQDGADVDFDFGTATLTVQNTTVAALQDDLNFV